MLNYISCGWLLIIKHIKENLNGLFLNMFNSHTAMLNEQIPYTPHGAGIFTYITG